jgi:hypothetical protein
MKTLTTLTAVAALIAGMSIASAQTSPPNTMDKGATGAKMAPAPQATGNGKFCTETSSGGVLNCKYATLADCKKVAKPNVETCAANPKSATTGSK